MAGLTLPSMVAKTPTMTSTGTGTTSQVHADLVRFETAQARYKRMCKLSPQVILRAPLVYIASYLQMTPETLSRVRSSTLLDD